MCDEPFAAVVFRLFGKDSWLGGGGGGLPSADAGVGRVPVQVVRVPVPVQGGRVQRGVRTGPAVQKKCPLFGISITKERCIDAISLTS